MLKSLHIPMQVKIFVIYFFCIFFRTKGLADTFPDSFAELRHSLLNYIKEIRTEPLIFSSENPALPV